MTVTVAVVAHRRRAGPVGEARCGEVEDYPWVFGHIPFHVPDGYVPQLRPIFDLYQAFGGRYWVEPVQDPLEFDFTVPP